MAAGGCQKRTFTHIAALRIWPLAFKQFRKHVVEERFWSRTVMHMTELSVECEMSEAMHYRPGS